MGAMVGASLFSKLILKPANPNITLITSAGNTPAGSKSARPKPKLGLRAWMERVLVEGDRAAPGFAPDQVNDLRVGLRAGLSLGEGLVRIHRDSPVSGMKVTGVKPFK